MIEDALYTKLTSVAAITALVSTRIYPNEAPRGETHPYVTYTKLSTSRMRHLQGTSAHGTTRTTFTIEAISPLYSDVKTVGNAIRAALDAGPSVTYPATWGSTRVTGTHVEDQGDEFETPKTAEDQLLHRESLDVVVWWNET